MNKVILIGRMCGDAVVRRTQTGKAVASYRLAVDRIHKKEGQPDADFINCVAFGKSGEFAGNYLRKGMKIAAEGRIQTRDYDDNDGKTVYVTEVIVDRHEFCERKSDNDGGFGHSNSFPAADPVGFPSEPDYPVIDDGSELPF